MANENKIYLTANDLASMLDISVGHAYKIIRRMNNDLEKQGYLAISGKLPKKYFEKHWFGMESA
ncbi:MAG: ICEBs1 excisionase [Lachnospiraceae bacterium]|nr:ICEBs1 excisionase [Lachnospiraceae bacterium]